MEYSNCTECGLDTPLDLMKKDGRAKSGYMSPAICNACHAAKKRARLAKTQKARRDRTGHAEWYRKYMRLKNYQMTEEQYEEMLKAQGGCCAICGTDSPGEKDWATDHDHSCCPQTPTCGQCSRGLLCHKCNRMLGLANDRIEVLEAAIKYLKPPTYKAPDLKGVVNDRVLPTNAG